MAGLLSCGSRLASPMFWTVARGVLSSGSALKSTSFASSILLNVGGTRNGIPPRSFSSGPQQIRFTEKFPQPSFRPFASSFLNVGGIHDGSPRSIGSSSSRRSPRICLMEKFLQPSSGKFSRSYSKQSSQRISKKWFVCLSWSSCFLTFTVLIF